LYKRLTQTGNCYKNSLYAKINNCRSKGDAEDREHVPGRRERTTNKTTDNLAKILMANF